MADASAHAYLTKDIDYGKEDIKFFTGVVILKTKDGDSVALSGFREAEAHPKGLCNRCGEQGYIACDCPKKPVGKLCKVCGEFSYVKINCLIVECSNCYQLGHIKLNCNKPLTCYTCGNPGYYAKDCYIPKLKQKGKKKVNGTCSNCGQQGHYVVHCLNKVCSNCNNAGYLLEDCMEGPKLSASKSSDDTKPDDSGKSSNDTKPDDGGKSSNNTKPDNSGKSSNDTKPDDGGKSSNDTKPDEGGKSTDDTLTKPPYGMPLKPVKRCLTAKLVTVLSEKHISSIGLAFDGCFESEKSRSGWEHKTALALFTYNNLVDPSTSSVTVVKDPNTDVLFALHVLEEQRALVKQLAGLNTATELLHVKVDLCTVGNGP